MTWVVRRDKYDPFTHPGPGGRGGGEGPGRGARARTGPGDGPGDGDRRRLVGVTAAVRSASSGGNGGRERALVDDDQISDVHR